MMTGMSHLGLNMAYSLPEADSRRDSGFSNSSLDDLSVGIMTSHQGLPSEQASSAPSFVLSPPPSNDGTLYPPIDTIDVEESSTPIVPSMPIGMSYVFMQQHQHQGPPSVVNNQSAPTSASWNIASMSSQMTALTSSPIYTTDDLVYQQLSLALATSGQQKLMTSPHVYSKHGQVQRPRQKKPHLQISTEADVAAPALLNNMTVEFTAACDGQWDAGYDLSPSAPVQVISPSMSAANNIVRTQQSYPWGFVTSPVESNFSSGTSTPLFTSSPVSYANSEIATSCQSSRAASPSYAGSGIYDGCIPDRRSRQSPNPIIRSRKSSTSSMGSQGRVSHLRDSSASSTASSSPAATTSNSSSTSSHQCPKCGQCFAGPAVLVRHIESIHEKLLWNCVGCKSNLSRRDAVTRHINLSPMDSICRIIGTIGQIKISNGVEAHYEVSSYCAKPLDEVMNRMGKKISTALRREINRSKAAMHRREAGVPEGCVSSELLSFEQAMMMHAVSDDMEMLEDWNQDGSSRKRRRSPLADNDMFERKRR
ncbi:hypothetical protein BG011_004792 [Mortierella polycephala]|uniref:C2H2-type domain-containing protein n=1 Tax=Mortierella polycephala TaxID=41804 RepID=A0A9P6U9T7_9FUNG|nr:hypothetical protein BG011_004792 [Mortierella polycephala]